MLKVRQDDRGLVPTDDMIDGDVAEVISFPLDPKYVGSIVMRYRNMLIHIGEEAGYQRPQFFERIPSTPNRGIVKIIDQENTYIKIINKKD